MDNISQMDNISNDTSQTIFYIIAILVIGFMIYIWLTKKQANQLSQLNQLGHFNQVQPTIYHIHYNKPTTEPFKSANYNVDSIQIGGHNCSHNSAIVGSAFNRY